MKMFEHPTRGPFLAPELVSSPVIRSSSLERIKLVIY